MTKAYSDDLRVRVVRAVEAGASRRATAAKFEVSVSFVIRLVRQLRMTGSAKVRGIGGRPHHKLESHADRVDGCWRRSGKSRWTSCAERWPMRA